MVVQPIVEGQGDVAAAPILLRRLAAEAEAWNVQIARPHRRRRNRLSRMADFQNAVRVALLTPDCTGVLILFDADDDCPRECAPEFEAWAREASRDVPSAVVMANHEYEAWFLASMKSLRETRHVRADAVDHPSACCSKRATCCRRRGPRPSGRPLERLLGPRLFRGAGSHGRPSATLAAAPATPATSAGGIRAILAV